MSGINQDSVLNIGAFVADDARAGTTVSWAYSDRIRVGFAFDLGYRPDYNINVAELRSAAQRSAAHVRQRCEHLPHDGTAHGADAVVR